MAARRAHEAPEESRATRLISTLRPSAGFLRHAGVVALILLALELLLFWSYFGGGISPAPDDFIGSYNNEPFAWWRDVSALDLPDWVPFAWGGYPAAISIQSGAWYLPIGLAAAISPYTIHAAAALQALHVAFGALGVYVLAQRWGLGRISSSFGLVAYFFAVGFYTNGLHPDIVRGFAWAPWVLLCLSPAYPWKRWWATPIAALIVWQTLAASYPGIIVALVYCGMAYVIANQVSLRLKVRDYLLPLAVAVVAGVLLAAPKYLPALEFRGTGSPTGLDDSVFSANMFATLFFPYDLDRMPNDLSMRSFFVVAPCLALLFVARRSKHLSPVVAFGGTAALLGLPFFPWYSLLGNLPGMSISRFRMSDFRVPLVLAVVLCATITLSYYLRESDASVRSPRRSLIQLGGLALLAGGALFAAISVDYPIERWTTPWTILIASIVTAAVLARTGPHRWYSGSARPAAAGIALILLAAVSGVHWAYSVMPPWRFPREEIEVRAWGTTSDQLVAEYSPAVGLTQRPARTPLDDAVAPPMSVHWNSSFYTGVDAVGGYVNLKGSGSFDRALQAVLDPNTYFQARSVLAAPGIGIAVDGDDTLPAAEAVVPCALEGTCGPGLTVHPNGYSVGHLRYAITAATSTSVLFNEAYYRGWTITACAQAQPDQCQVLEPRLGGAGMIVTTVPGGDWRVSLDYRTPGKVRDRVAFLAGLLLVVGAGTVAARGARAPARDAADGEKANRRRRKPRE